MTAKAGQHRTIRLPEDLAKRTDSVRWATPRERWIRALLYRVTGDLLVGNRTVVLEFGPRGELLDGPRAAPPPADDVDALAVITAEALRDRVDASRENPDGPTEEEDDLLAEAERLEAAIRDSPGFGEARRAGARALARTGDVQQAVRVAPDALRAGLDATAAPRMRLKRPAAKP